MRKLSTLSSPIVRSVLMFFRKEFIIKDIRNFQRRMLYPRGKLSVKHS